MFGCVTIFNYIFTLNLEQSRNGRICSKRYKINAFFRLNSQTTLGSIFKNNTSLKQFRIKCLR